MIEYLLENPIEVNTATIDDLTKIPFVNSEIAERIIQYKNKYGDLYSIGELNNVEGIDKQLFAKIKPYLVIDRSRFSKFNEEQNVWEETTRKNFYQLVDLNYRTRAIQDIQKRKGFETGKYQYSPLKFYQRVKVAYDKTYKFNLLTEKDPGEKNLADFYSFNLSLNNVSFIKNLLIGDYVLEFGQGLILWRSIGLAKSADAVFPIKKKGNGIIPYTSTDENQFFRGVAASFSFSDLTASIFYSANTFDANIDTLTSLITSRPIDGFHRTESEINKKDQSKENLLGGRLEYSFGRPLSIGATFFTSSFQNKFAPNTSFKNCDDRYNAASIDFNSFIESLNLFGEISRDKNNVFASVVGLQSSLSRKIDFVLLFRNYPAKFINLHGYGFGERNGATQNETGVYGGLRLASTVGTINFYYDYFRFPYPLTNDKTITGGNEFLTEFVSSVFYGTNLLIRYKHEKKETNISGIDEYNRTKKFTTNRLQQNLRIEFQKRIGSTTRLRLRSEIVDVYYSQIKPHEIGYLIFGDIKIEPIKFLKVNSRFIYFQTDSYDSRVYEFENDLNGVLFNPGLYGRGMRWYVVAQYKIFKFINLSLKYSETFRDDVKKIGSGDSEINNNLDNRLSLQLEINF